ncbi:hypothetical protein [Endozoicomonas atrinae]|uniref:hypothetical protein n=1 Tax=Endozoicomonas atrinae TaxID=1333660 RepID=UPI0008254D03|nr:hypothetical protein [Endozoicomonas atrinae]
MKVRKTLIFPLEHQNSDDLNRHSLLYRAANWLETTMRALQEHREAERKSEDEKRVQLLLPEKPALSFSRHFPFRRCLMRTRFFMPTRGRLRVCTNLKRPGPYHW